MLDECIAEAGHDLRVAPRLAARPSSRMVTDRLCLSMFASSGRRHMNERPKLNCRVLHRAVCSCRFDLCGGALGAMPCRARIRAELGSHHASASRPPIAGFTGHADPQSSDRLRVSTLGVVRWCRGGEPSWAENVEAEAGVAAPEFATPGPICARPLPQCRWATSLRSPSSTSPTPPIADRATAKPRFSVSNAIAFLTGSGRALRYFYACRRKFISPDFLSIAVDASRISRKKVLLSVMALPTNAAMWAPPQVGIAHCAWYLAPELARLMAGPEGRTEFKTS